MTNKDVSFETWFEIVALNVLDRTGFEFADMDAVQADYDAGRDANDVIDEIAAEYGDDDE